MGIGAATLAFAVLAFIVWLAYLVTQTRVRRRRAIPPQNLTPYMTDDELESKRLNKTLVSALLSTAVIAIVMPIYYLNESARQESAADHFDEIAVERGHEWWIEYQCLNCHGADGSGGGAPYVEKRSGLGTTWSAPSLNDVLYRYTVDETRFWITYGRQGTPMPAWGVPGGGPLNTQQIDELLAYIESIQISQEDALARVDRAVNAEIARMENADAAVDSAIAAQQAAIDALALVPGQYAAVEPLPAELEATLAGAGTCTADSARLLATTCSSPGADQDRDGLSDAAEQALESLLDRILASSPPSTPRAALTGLAFDPANPFTTSEGSTPIPDLEQASVMVTEFAAIARDLRLTTDNLDSLTASAQDGLAFLEDQRARRPYAVDLDQIAADAFDGDTDLAARAAALYNITCARCHTAGYSAGTAFTQLAGSGAFGPALVDGRTVIQFPDADDHYSFIVKGSENAVAYGVNGIGRGWMPGFGALLTEADIRLIVDFERALP